MPTKPATDGLAAALRDVSVEYPGRGRVMGPFTLELAAGEIIALVGPSGCGKSTALRLLAGLEQPTSGHVMRAARSGETSVVFQAPTLAPWLNARANAALPLELGGMSREEARTRAEVGLKRVGLAHAMLSRPRELSGGMAMRVSLARALVTEPAVLLLDEPFAALDEITRRNLADDVLAIWSEQKPAIVFVTHNVEEAVYMASRVLVMSSGPGRLAGETRIEGPLPRPPHFRTSEAFRQAAETVSSQLAAAMEGA